MSCPGAVSLYTTFGATHRGGGFLYIQIFPVTQEKSLSLTCRQALQTVLNQPEHLRALKRLYRSCKHTGPFSHLHGVERIVIVFVLLAL